MPKLVMITALSAALAAAITEHSSALAELKESSADLLQVQEHLAKAGQIPDDPPAPPDLTDAERVYSDEQHAAAIRIATRGVEAALGRQQAAILRLTTSADSMRAALAAAQEPQPAPAAQPAPVEPPPAPAPPVDQPAPPVEQPTPAPSLPVDEPARPPSSDGPSV